MISFSYIAFVFIASVTPGPANVTVLSISSSGNKKAAMKFLLGSCTGFSVVALLGLSPFLSVGLADFLLSHDHDIGSLNLLSIIHYLGLAYLLYIAFQIFTDDDNVSLTRQGFLHGLMIQLLSVKSWLFVVTAYTLFLDLHDFTFFIGLGHAVVLMGMGIVAQFIWMNLGRFANDQLNESLLPKIRKFFALILAGMVVSMFISSYNL